MFIQKVVSPLKVWLRGIDKFRAMSLFSGTHEGEKLLFLKLCWVIQVWEAMAWFNLTDIDRTHTICWHYDPKKDLFKCQVEDFGCREAHETLLRVVHLVNRELVR